MLGLLGGLLGRAIGGGLARGAFAARPSRGPLGGLLANRMMAARRGQPGFGQGSRRQPEQRAEQEQQQAPQQEPMQQAQVAEPVQQQQTQPQPFVQQASQPIRETAQQQQQASVEPPPPPGQPKEVEPQQPVTAGLLDDTPAVPDARPRNPEEPIPEPQAVVNQTDSPAPVARPEQEEFGATPMLATSGILDNKMDDTPPRRDFPMEDPNPSQPVQMSQAKHTANSPGFHYQTAGTYTAFTPSYSYRRR